jgi:5-methylcytosine-specific restriction endonuclease McrBC GTP-binding regulatory subunit McrB
VANHSKPYALFIDEINRGNVASIFGELITLIEDDKRIGQKNEIRVTLPYSREIFGVPDNLYLIGTMNTADRSVEALDTALRRRFTFEEMRPDPKLISQPERLSVDLPKLFAAINARLEKLLDHDHCIGHAYFMKVGNLSELRQVFANKIIPLLREYFYGHPAKIGMVLGEQFITRNEAEVKFAAGDWGVDSLDDKAVFCLTEPAGWTEDDFKSIYA